MLQMLATGALLLIGGKLMLECCCEESSSSESSSSESSSSESSSSESSSSESSSSESSSSESSSSSGSASESSSSESSSGSESGSSSSGSDSGSASGGGGCGDPPPEGTSFYATVTGAPTAAELDRGPDETPEGEDDHPCRYLCRGGDPPDWPWEERYVCPNGSYLIQWQGTNWSGLHVDDPGPAGRSLGFVANDDSDGWVMGLSDSGGCYSYASTKGLYPCTGIYPPSSFSMTWVPGCDPSSPYSVNVTLVLP